MENKVEIEERFLAQTVLDGAEIEERFLSTQADTFAGENVKEKRRPAPLGMTNFGTW